MAYIVRNNPNNNVSVANELDRVWDSLLTNRGSYPAVDIIENDSDYRLEADLPGVSEKNVEVKLEDRVLIVQSAADAGEEVESEAPRYLIRERKTRSFRRSFVVPKDADVSGIEASFKNGVLELSIPKLPEAKPRSIEIKHG